MREGKNSDGSGSCNEINVSDPKLTSCRIRNVYFGSATPIISYCRYKASNLKVFFYPQEMVPRGNMIDVEEYEEAEYALSFI
jgi:hypothetical protein